MCPRRPIPLAAFATALLAVAATAAPAPAAPSAVVATLAPGTRASALGSGARPALPPALVARLEARIGRGLPELRRLYRLEVAGPAQAQRLARRLNTRAGVEAAAERQPVAPPAVCRLAPPAGWPAFSPDAPSADLTGLQDYRDGLAVPADATGVGARIADVEYDWRSTHEELSARGLPAPVLPPGGLPFPAEDHGTAVLGILGADADGHGITGLAPAAELRPLSPFLATDPSRFDPAGAILEAAAGLRPGDVMLVEQQVGTWTTSGLEAYGPIEANVAVREVIRVAVEKMGIVVVEPAGNAAPSASSGVDLAALGAPWLADPSSPQNSGALIVGAGGSSGVGTDRDMGRAAISNFGARVDVQGYGEGVVTSGYGQLIGPPGLPDRRYTACFDGTSSAAATVAGAIAALQGIVIGHGRPPLTPAQVRDALIATGRPQVSLGGDPIGPRPQVAAAAAMALGTVPPQPAPGGGVAPGSAPPPASGAGEPPASSGDGPATARRPALGGLSARLDRRSRRLTVGVRGLAPRAVVTVDGRRVRVARGVIVLAGVHPGRLVVRASAPSRPGVAYRPARYVIVVPRSGPARVIRR